MLCSAGDTLSNKSFGAFGVVPLFSVLFHIGLAVRRTSYIRRAAFPCGEAWYFRNAAFPCGEAWCLCWAAFFFAEAWYLRMVAFPVGEAWYLRWAAFLFREAWYLRR